MKETPEQQNTKLNSDHAGGIHKWLENSLIQFDGVQNTGVLEVLKWYGTPICIH